ncbi:DNA mismatch repair protein Mlh1 [Orchesella cincta]|uniref:DNA mismatch repair protein Mlh1 n=1 Tax=Orchesella cincta TaxID=48709 RepID=A0A1D2N675_ORCCI|nr:DNA mismatch repair protein Mlh1 [Orchesella cincta]
MILVLILDFPRTTRKLFRNFLWIGDKMAKIPGKIKKLEEVVINRIAAGEVIQRPANALKELLENSLDAGSSNIQVVVKSGGMKLLQIQDDGTGIRKDDLPIVCERFTTSKLEKFEDLQRIGTYGFRGEALASISHVAHLTIITKTEDSQCAFRAEYSDGKLKLNTGFQNPKPCAGKQGTLIMAEDLFYNMETRRRALKSVAEEHNKIVEVVTKYAVHNARVGFSLKKFGETMTEMRTQSQSSVLDNIKLLYGAAIARELVEIRCEDKTTGFTLNGYVSNANYSTKKLTFLLFINHRLVDSSGLRKSIESVYYNYLPKGSHPFVYLSIDIDPRNVDVNVHPTKHEVTFLHEDMIITSITNSVENVLLGSNHSRTFFVQDDNQMGRSSVAAAPKNLVRTDPKMQKLDKFLNSTPDPDISILRSFNDSPSRVGVLDTSDFMKNSTVRSPSEAVTPNPNEIAGKEPIHKRREIRLRSVRNMRQKVEADSDKQLTTAFKNHTFVGCVDRSLALIQYELNLYICNTFKLSAELFYQKIIYDFANFGRITIEEPITIKELVMIAIEAGEPCGENKTSEDVAEAIQKLLVGKAKMLEDYFCVCIDQEGRLLAIPYILEGYFPSMEGLPTYIMNVARKVEWTNERACFETFCHQTSLFYAVQPGGSKENDELTSVMKFIIICRHYFILAYRTSTNGQSWKWTIEHVVYPEIKKCLLPPKIFAEDSTVAVLTSLPDLYKVFERC